MYPMHIYLIIIFSLEQSNICFMQKTLKFSIILQESDRIYGC